MFINTAILLLLLSSFVLIFFAFMCQIMEIEFLEVDYLEMLTTFSISGYAIPGIILAVAFISFISWFDNTID